MSVMPRSRGTEEPNRVILKDFSLLALCEICPFDNLARRVLALFRVRNIRGANDVIFADDRDLMSQQSIVRFGGNEESTGR
jgi:hypothetical protein